MVHSQAPLTLPPPLNLEMVQQSVQDDSYSITIKWDHPKLLPLASYRVYVNSQLRTTVSNNSNSTAVSLTNVPRHEVSFIVVVFIVVIVVQFVYISVRTCIHDLESPDPQKMIEINPR